MLLSRRAEDDNKEDDDKTEEEDSIIRTAGHGSPGRAHFRRPFTTFSASLKVKGTTMTSEAGLLL
jgi:hypothetical protein